MTRPSLIVLPTNEDTVWPPLVNEAVWSSVIVVNVTATRSTVSTGASLTAMPCT